MFKGKIKWIIIASILLVTVAGLIVYPNIEFSKNGRLYVCRYSDDFSEFEENPSYNELYFYNKKRDISIKTFNVKNFLCFYVLSFDYEEGDKRETQFVLDESYISNFLENAEIYDNAENINVAELIKGKTAVIGNNRYTTEDERIAIFYTLDGKDEEMYIFETDGMTVIQVGSTDESPKYIAYK